MLGLAEKSEELAQIGAKPVEVVNDGLYLKYGGERLFIYID